MIGPGPGDCFSCWSTADPAAPPRERVLRTKHWRAAHALGTALPGWLVLLPVRHVESIALLDADAATELGPLLAGLTAALRTVTGCLKTYVLLMAEQEGFAHLHFHVVPRAPDLPGDLRGPSILGLLAADEAARIGTEEQDRIAERIRDALPRWEPHPGSCR